MMMLKFLLRISIYPLFEKLSEDTFSMLANKLPYEWQRIARLLLFNETDLDHLKADFSTTYEQTFQMFNKW